jgi:rhodanese-related sulfurtransferase
MADEIVVLDRDAVKRGLADGSLLLVDVREPHEWDAGHIPGSVLMPLSQFDPGALPAGDGRRVVFSCAAGARTLKAIAISQGEGYDFNYHYAGSFRDWATAGEPVEAG